MFNIYYPSVDGFIATEDGGVDWLETVASSLSLMEEKSKLMQYFNDSFKNYIDSVDCMIIGRKLMEVLSSFDLSIPTLLGKGIPLFGNIFIKLKF